MRFDQVDVKGCQMQVRAVIDLRDVLSAVAHVPMLTEAAIAFTYVVDLHGHEIECHTEQEARDLVSLIIQRTRKPVPTVRADAETGSAKTE